MTKIQTAVVIGGGIAGPATAMALQKAGIEATVYEAHAIGADGIGVFLTLASNGVDALRVLGADEPALAAGFPTPKITLRTASGKFLGETRTGQTLPDGTTSQTLKRADLYRVLHDEASRRGIRIEYGKRLIGAEPVDGGARAKFTDGSEARGDLLIGCDGINSAVRSLIDPGAPPPTYSGLVTTGGYTRGLTVDVEPGSYEMIFGRRAFFGHATAPDGEVWWFSNIPRRAEPARGELEAITVGERRRLLLDLHAGDVGPAQRLIEATTAIEPLTPIHSIPHLPRWHRDRMIVIGDAAHAPSPTSGQGASLSIEDAVVLAKCLRDRTEPELAFEAFEATRRPRAERIIKAAARINNSKAAGPVGRAVRDAVMPLVLRMTANSASLRATSDYHIEWGSDSLLPD